MTPVTSTPQRTKAHKPQLPVPNRNGLGKLGRRIFFSVRAGVLPAQGPGGPQRPNEARQAGEAMRERQEFCKWPPILRHDITDNFPPRPQGDYRATLYRPSLTSFPYSVRAGALTAQRIGHSTPKVGHPHPVRGVSLTDGTNDWSQHPKGATNPETGTARESPITPAKVG